MSSQTDRNASQKRRYDQNVIKIPAKDAMQTGQYDGNVINLPLKHDALRCHVQYEVMTEMSVKNQQRTAAMAS